MRRAQVCGREHAPKLGGPGTPIAFHIGVPILYCDLAWPPRQWHTSLPGGHRGPGDLNRGPVTFGIQNLGPPARSHDFIPQRPWGSKLCSLGGGPGPQGAMCATVVGSRGALGPASLQNRHSHIVAPLGPQGLNPNEYSPDTGVLDFVTQTRKHTKNFSTACFFRQIGKKR